MFEKFIASLQEEKIVSIEGTKGMLLGWFLITVCMGGITASVIGNLGMIGLGLLAAVLVILGGYRRD